LRAALLLLTILGCREPELESPMAAESAATTAANPSLRSCPMAIAGTTVDVQDIAGGAALVFRTDVGDVVGLRQRVRYLGDLYELPDAQRQWLRVRGGREPVEQDEPTMSLPDATTEMIPVDGGARLEIRAADAADADRLRALVHMHRDQLEAGHCWTWQPRIPERPKLGV
jgi:hypothetical protein